MIKSFYDYSPRFRRRMQQNVLWATLSVLLLVLGLEVSLYRTVRKNVSRERINHLQQQIETPFTLLVERMIKTNLEGIRQMGEQGILDLTDPDTLNKHMLHALSKVPLQGVLQIADEDGGEFLMYETGLAPPTRLVRDSDLDGWKSWDGGGGANDGKTTDFEYDTRTQAWYTVEQEQNISWLIPSEMPGKHELTEAISAAIRWKSSGKSSVAALHFPLKEVMGLLLLFSGSEEGTIFGPFESEDAIAVMSSEEQGTVHILQLGEFSSAPSSSTAAAEPDAHRAISAFMQQQWQNRLHSDKELVGDVRVNSSHWWIGARQMILGAQIFWLGIAVPEKSLSSAIQRGQKSMTSVLISTAVLALILLGIQLRFFLRTSKEIETEYIELQERKQGILQLIAQGESSRLEFKSTIRWNLNTNKAGKEIEIAWLKTVVAYLNSEGGTILLGVRDDGEVLGLEADNFQNEDRLLLHVNNLLKQHVGLEFVQFITVTLHHVGERQVLSIRCIPAKAPVFLMHNKDEQFYIRTGPSTLLLSSSEMLKYLSQQAGK